MEDNKYIYEIKSFIKRYLKEVLLFLCLILFIIILKSVLNKEISNFDLTVYRIISSKVSNNITIVMKSISFLGGTFFLIGLSLLLFFLFKNKKISLMIILNLSFSFLTNSLLKIIVQRKRPIENILISETGYSFPSGHSMVSMAFYDFLIYLILHKVKNKFLKYMITIILLLLILLIGISRIYLGVHYASDVIGGFLVGMIFLILYIKSLKKYFDYLS